MYEIESKHHAASVDRGSSARYCRVFGLRFWIRRPRHLLPRYPGSVLRPNRGPPVASIWASRGDHWRMLGSCGISRNIWRSGHLRSPSPRRPTVNLRHYQCLDIGRRQDGIFSFNRCCHRRAPHCRSALIRSWREHICGGVHVAAPASTDACRRM